MLGLQEKAHISLSDFRKGKLLTVARQMSPETAVDDGDELDTLGGRTRLVAKKGTSGSPPLIERSPTSLNPVIPLPLSSTYDDRVHPSVVEYLRTFADHQIVSERDSVVMSTSPQSYGDSSLYGLTSIARPHQASFNRQSPLQQHPQPYNHVSQEHEPYRSMSEIASFPQYFPVYDYTSEGSQHGYHPIHMDSDMANANSQEENMHTTWQDFVATLGMN